MSRSNATVFTQANQAFKEGRYDRALELYLQCGKLYGEHLVSLNVRLCRAKISENKPHSATKCIITDGSIPSSTPISCANNSLSVNQLDPATRYILAKAGKIDLTDEEMELCLIHHAKLTARKSEDAEIKPDNPIPPDWPEDLILPPLPESTNDFHWHLARRRLHPKESAKASPGISVIVPTFNRSKILDITLACLVNQRTNYPFEVVVADDGSKEDLVSVVRKHEASLDIKYVRQRDYGYQLCAVRNLGMRTAKYDYLAILDCDMAPNPKWVESYISLLIEDEDVALIGPRKYVDTSSYSAEDFLENPELVETLPEVLSPDTVGRLHAGGISVDWRLNHFQETENLRLCDTPFRFFSGGNVAFARKWLTQAGWFDEDFTHWGGEDNEFGYRLYRAGCFFRAISDGMAYHQEPPGKENETDRAEGMKITNDFVKDKVPYFYRKVTPLTLASLHSKPLVSIYIPAYNCASYIRRCVDSALNQTVVDLEVCICDDGSTDNTLDVIMRSYGNNPRVRVKSQANKGIGSASNTAVHMTRGYYIGQLDSDDYLEPDAVELCLKEFFSDRKLACVYTTNRNVEVDGELIKNGYNWPTFSREKLTTAMIAHHFRMFTSRAWHLTEGFDEVMKNSVDYDMYLKLSEIGPFKHINKISYNRTLHGQNTSLVNSAAQKQNHYIAVNRSLKRQGISNIKCVAKDSNLDNRDCCFFRLPIS